MYQIQTLAALSGVSTRTLRYYHQIGLLVPKIGANGYRWYDDQAVDQLQLILMYRQLDFSLAQIKVLVQDPPAKRLAALQAQRAQLQEKQINLDRTMQQLATTIKNQRREIMMQDEEKFAAFKAEQVEKNTQHFGQEVVQRWGQAAKDAADAKYLGLSQATLAQMHEFEQALSTALNVYLAQPKLPSEPAKVVFDRHRQWLQLTWPNYTPEVHRGLATMYVADERFSQYYDQLLPKTQPGSAAQALRDIVTYYTV